jgi:hypothetical protein
VYNNRMPSVFVCRKAIINRELDISRTVTTSTVHGTGCSIPRICTD